VEEQGTNVGSDDPAKMRAATESLWKVYGSLNEWVRFTDAKAAAVLAADGVLAGAAISALQGKRELLMSHPAALSALVIGLAALVASAAYCIFCISPSVETGPLKWFRFSRHPLAEFAAAPTSLIFFGHVAAKNKDGSDRFGSAGAFAEEAKRAFGDDALALEQISQQVLANSRVAYDKCKQVAWAIKFLAVALLFGLIGALAALVN